MKIKNNWIKFRHFCYKYFEVNFLNTAICVLVGLLVNTYTAGTFNEGFVCAMIFSSLSILLTLMLIYFQSYLKRSVEQNIVKNQRLKDQDKLTSLEAIEEYSLQFNRKSANSIPVLFILIVIAMCSAVFSFQRGERIGDPSEKLSSAQTKQELDSIINICKSEQLQLIQLRQLISRMQIKPNREQPRAKHELNRMRNR